MHCNPPLTQGSSSMQFLQAAVLLFTHFALPSASTKLTLTFVRVWLPIVWKLTWSPAIATPTTNCMREY